MTRWCVSESLYRNSQHLSNFPMLLARACFLFSITINFRTIYNTIIFRYVAKKRKKHQTLFCPFPSFEQKSSRNLLTNIFYCCWLSIRTVDELLFSMGTFSMCSRELSEKCFNFFFFIESREDFWSFECCPLRFLLSLMLPFHAATQYDVFVISFNLSIHLCCLCTAFLWSVLYTLWIAWFSLFFFSCLRLQLSCDDLFSIEVIMLRCSYDVDKRRGERNIEITWDCIIN